MKKTISLFMVAATFIVFLLPFFCCTTYAVSYYCDSPYFDTSAPVTYTLESITFDRYEVTEMYLDRLCPIYTNVTQLNSCAPMAGSILVGYYDYTAENLIPNYQAGVYYNGQFRYRAQTDTIVAMKEYLYDLMGTNTLHAGTSVGQFCDGMTAFVKEKGYNIQFDNCGTNIDTMRGFLTAQKPIALFLNSYNYYEYGGISTTQNQMSMLRRSSENGHVLVAYGYKEYKFFTANQAARTNKYLVVSFGDGTSGLVPVNSVETIDESYAINIF